MTLSNYSVGVSLLSLDGMLVHHWVSPALNLPFISICVIGWREALKVKCLALKDNTPSVIPGHVREWCHDNDYDDESVRDVYSSTVILSFVLFPSGLFWFILLAEYPSSFTLSSLLRLTHRRGLVPATSPCNKSWGRVALCELAIFASKSSCRDQLWSLRLVPWIQAKLNFWNKSLRLAPQKASCELFVGQVPATVPFV